MSIHPMSSSHIVAILIDYVVETKGGYEESLLLNLFIQRVCRAYAAATAQEIGSDPRHWLTPKEESRQVSPITVSNEISKASRDE